MPIIGFDFKSIGGKVNDLKSDRVVGVHSVPNIETIERKELDVPGIKDVLSIGFTFITMYDPSIGEIKITGEVLYQTDDAEKVLEMWKDKRLETKVVVDVLNAIFKKCLAKTVSLCDELNLPSPLTFPVVKTEPMPKAAKEKNSAGS